MKNLNTHKVQHEAETDDVKKSWEVWQCFFVTFTVAGLARCLLLRLAAVCAVTEGE